MHYNKMKNSRISRERLFAQLRNQNLSHLGAVKRLYLEPSGSFALVKNEKPKPGLMVLPDSDHDFVSRKLKVTDIVICKNCGKEAPDQNALQTTPECPNCKDNDWTKAVQDL
jgi:uncharacterized membrane protein YcaP (DUF421 family)